jgi:hypothetical protein
VSAAAAGVSLAPDLVCGAASPRIVSSAKDNGYRGIWFTLGQKSAYGDKYSGGLATYTANHVPIAIYAAAVGKTFFVYGGAKEGKRHLLAMASYYDHRRHVVPRPTIVHDKQGVNDPHDNPSLGIDAEGHLWIFVSGRAKVRPGLIYRSVKPYSTEEFEQVSQSEFTYPQPRWIEGRGWFFLFTKYTNGRELYFRTSRDGRQWSEDRKLAGIGGHYQTSHQVGDSVITAFNMHPGGNVDKRTNLYYLLTDDAGATWRNVRGERVNIPLTEPDNSALVHNYQTEKKLVYIHDLDLDENGRPVILYLTSDDFRPGPKAERWWTVAHWLGDGWQITRLTPANHNYSTGSTYLEKANRWRVFGPTEKGPQPLGAGGEIGIWYSEDQGQSWRKEQQLTRGSALNHNYVRRPLHAHSDFYAFWGDGNPDVFSRCNLYFTNLAADKVWRLPYEMARDFAEPEPLL